MPWYFSCKSHWFCGLVQIHPQDVVVFILNTATESGWLSPWDPPLQWGKVRKRIYRPATHPIHFAADSPDKIIAALRGRYFSFRKCTLKISWADRTWYRLSVNAAAQTGAGTSFGANGDQHTRAVELSTYFCVLTIRKHLLKIRFERSGRGQEPSRGHKFSILENFLFIRDFTSAMRLHFRSNLVGACLPQTLLMVRTWRCEQQRRVVLT